MSQLEALSVDRYGSEDISEPQNLDAPQRSSFTPLVIISAILCAGYAYLFYNSIAPYWFHPNWTTDDALQQVYPFHEVYHPGIFENDIITEVMKGYLAPIHYWMGYALTWLTGDPIMASHWMMLIQIVLAVGFMFAFVKRAAGLVPAFFSVAWLLHTRHVMQRLTAGLPRGWAAPMFTAFLYFAFTGNHWAVLVTILFGCLLNPPAALVIALCYGLLLCARSIAGSSAPFYRKKLAIYAALSPLYALLTLAIVHRSPEVGQMVSFDVASAMPEFSRPYGRFPFIPFNPASDEIRVFGLQAFMGRFYNPAIFWRDNMLNFVLGALGITIVAGLIRRRVTIPLEIILFGVSSLAVYFASRILAFNLYVPNRHLQFPLAIFFISAFSIGLWRAFHRGPESVTQSCGFKTAWPATLAITVMGLLVYAGSNDGLFGAANFNYSSDKKGHYFDWLRQNTPENAMVAGHPTQLDGVQLFAIRKGYVTTETTHPFYVKYYEEMRRRTDISLRAHYSSSLEELVKILEPEGIDYFVFKRSDFYPQNLPNVTYFPPFQEMMQQLTSRNIEDYAFKKMPQEVDLDKAPYMPFKDKYSAIVDVKKLKEFLARGEQKHT